MRTTSLSVTAVLTAALSFLLATCKHASEPVQQEEGGVGIILPGIGMEGIKLGDSKETVLAKLGNPTEWGFTRGTYRDWMTCMYCEGPHSGLSFDFIEDSDGTAGPVDVIRTWTAYGPQYAGKTKDGIGRGSHVTMVRQVFGIPALTDHGSGGVMVDYYCVGNKELQIHFIDSLVTTMSIGYYLPSSGDVSYPCN